MRCQNCGSQTKDGANFCKECGAKIIKVEESPIEKVTSRVPISKEEQCCQHCGAALKKKDQKFCVNCGNTLDNAGQKEIQNTKQPSEQIGRPGKSPKNASFQKNKSMKYLALGAVFVIFLGGAYWLGSRTVGEPKDVQVSAEDTSPQTPIVQNAPAPVPPASTSPAAPVAPSDTTYNDEEPNDLREAETLENSYMIADSDTRKLTREELEGYSKFDLTLVRNEIYARHGYPFEMKEYQEYFGNKSWYMRNESYNYNLTATELANVDLIKEVEKKYK